MHKALAALIGATLIVYSTGIEAQSPYGIGRTATPAEIAGWNIDIGRDGSDAVVKFPAAR